MGVEESGRKLRYDFFDEVLEKENANKIAIAHNLNDNAETVLMHLLRGSGITGLCGIKPDREGKYIRPIIKCERAEIEQYLLSKFVLSYFSSNADFSASACCTIADAADSISVNLFIIESITSLLFVRN